MVEFEKLKKIILATKPVNIEHLNEFSEKLKEDSIKFAVVNDLSKLLPAIFKYAFHEEAKVRGAAIPAFIELVSILDLNKHLKEKPWWSDLKQSILESVDILMKLVSNSDENWPILWSTIVALLGTDLRTELPVLNKLLKVVEKAFKMNNEKVRFEGFECWCKLIDNFAINRPELNNKRRLNLLVIPLKANNHNTPKLCASKMQTWKHLLAKLDQHNEMTVQLLISHFLEFMFGGVGSLPAACKTLNTECADVFLQLLRTPVLFRVLPEPFIKYTFVCIEHVHEDLKLSLSIWEGLLGNLKRLQWAEHLVSELMTCLANNAKKDIFVKSKTFAQMVYTLYSGIHSMEMGLLVKYSKSIISIVLEPHVLINFTETWCSDLLDVIAKADPILLPSDIMGEIMNRLIALTKSQIFRDEKLKFLRGIWITVSNIFCKWMTEDGQVGKNGSLNTDMHNAHLMLLFGVAELSSMWNKYQMKSWKNLYSECVKYFSLLPDVKSDGFVTNLIELLLEGLRNSKIPLHVAVDIVSIILEFHLSKDASSILSMMMEVVDSGFNALSHDVAGTSALLTHYVKIIVAAARSEPALMNDILSVIDRMFKSVEEMPLPVREKMRNMILKAQHQLCALKPTKIADKCDTLGSSTAQPPSPTVTSFLHRLAKAKESQSKVGSPTSSQSSDMASSPIQNPNSKKSASPFADLKSEDFVFVPPKSRKTILTDHQKESLRTRKHDIPALYQDLSQDNSQSSYESIVTSVQTVEDDGNKVNVWRSPRKQKNSIELELKVLTPKKTSDTNLKTDTDMNTPSGKLLSNKENDYFNNTNSSPFSSVGQPEKSAHIDTTPLKAILQDDSFKKTCSAALKDTDERVVNLKGSLQTRNLRSKKNSKSSIMRGKTSQTNYTDSTDNRVLKCVHRSEKENSSHTGFGNENSHENEEQNVDLFSSEVNSSNTDSPNCNVDGLSTISFSDQHTPKRKLLRNRLIVSVKKGATKGIDSDSTNTFEQDPTNSFSGKINSQSSDKSPKISPRRLRKRSSGVTPVLSSGGFVKKKKLHLSQSPTRTKVTRYNNGSVGKNDVFSDKKTGSSKKSILMKNKKQPLDTNKELILETNKITKHNLEDGTLNTVMSSECDSKNFSKESKIENVTMISDKQVSGENVIENVKSSVSMTCSPVKIVLSRLESDLVNEADCNSNNKSQEYNGSKRSEESTLRKIENICTNDIGHKNLQNGSPVKNLMNMFNVINQEITSKSKDKENTNEEIILLKGKTLCLQNESLSTTKDFNISHNNQLIDEKVDENEIGSKNIKESDEGENKSYGVKSTSAQSKLDTEVNTTILPVNRNNLVEKELVLRIADASVNNKGYFMFISSTNDVSHIKEINDNNAISNRKSNNKIFEQSVNEIKNKSVESDDSIFLTKDSLEPKNLLTDDDCTNSKKLSLNVDSLRSKEDGNITMGHVNKKDVNTLGSEKTVLTTTDRSSMRVTRSMECNDFEITLEENKGNVEVSNVIELISSVEKSQKLKKSENTSEHSQLKKLIDISIPRQTRLKSSMNKTLDVDSKCIDDESNTLLQVPCCKESVCKEMLNSTEKSDSSVNQEKFTPLISNVEGITRNSDNVDSSLAVSKQTSSESTPIKSAQKHLRQTQLPFTPIQKSENSLQKCVNTKSVVKDQNKTNNEQNLSIDTNDIKPHPQQSKIQSPLLVLTKLNNLGDNIYLSPSKKQNPSTNKNISAIEINKLEGSSSINTKEMLNEPSEGMPKHSNNQEAPKTPEKISFLQKTHVHVLEIGPSEESVRESPTKTTDSQDIIESSQEHELATRSLVNTSRVASVGSLGALKLLSKSPKKHEAICFNNPNSASDRVLRSSPVKDDNLKHSTTPLKKSVCRRLDVEINVSSDNTEPGSADSIISTLPYKKQDNIQSTLNSEDSEELLNDIKILNGDNKLGKNTVSNNMLRIGLTDTLNIDESQPSTSTTNISPSTNKKLKRCLSEMNSGCTESPSRSWCSIWVEGSGSPRSPSSRTNQMMELAMQDKEKTISSPVSSLKKPRINPLRLGPVLRIVESPSTDVIHRSHNGPSEKWIRRTYSPSASPNSSILKRKGDVPPVSPDSSPPSLKKKRVSFLDPPVSESLLFSKAVPGKGHIQRPEHKRESESEEIASQGSMSVSPTKPSSATRIYSPLKLCPNPLTDLIERIVSVQWAPELESQLGRLGVTTVGQLSSLTEATIERLPFIPPKLERLKKILQNYYNEINEKPENTKTESITLENDECGIPSDEPERLIEPCKEVDDLTSPVCDDSKSLETVTAIADSFERYIELHPQLISELGSRLDIDTIMIMLKCAIAKLKNRNDTS